MQECPCCKKGILITEKTLGAFYIDGEVYSEHIERKCTDCNFHDDWYQ